MNSYPITKNVEHQYKGSGYALAATRKGNLVDIRYIRDMVDDFNPKTEFDVAQLINGGTLNETINEMKSIGEVHFGMCGSFLFSELKFSKE